MQLKFALSILVYGLCTHNFLMEDTTFNVILINRISQSIYNLARQYIPYVLMYESYFSLINYFYEFSSVDMHIGNALHALLHNRLWIPKITVQVMKPNTHHCDKSMQMLSTNKHYLP